MAWEESISEEEISLPANDMVNGETTLKPAPHMENPSTATGSLTSPAPREGDATTRARPTDATSPANSSRLRRPISSTR